MLYPKLKEENQKLWEKVFAMEKEIEDLKFQVSSSDVIISEYESKIEELKAENKQLMSKTNNNTSNISTEINNCSVGMPNARGAGRKSRVDEQRLNLMKSLENQGLSYSQIAKKLTAETKKPWSKSTVSYILNKNT